MSNGNGKKIVKSFERWLSRDVSDEFGVVRDLDSKNLRDWLDVSGKIAEKHVESIERLRKDLLLHVASWNEQELFGRFISLLLGTIIFSDYDKRIEEFAGRTLILPHEKYEIKGNVDWMTARGFAEPQTPYFFLHEYKRLRKVETDPLGQLLIAMVTAQKHNADGFPVYGAWILGKSWQFVLLDGNVYSESKTYDASDVEDITKIWLILNKTKQIIYDRVDKLIAIEKAENNK